MSKPFLSRGLRRLYPVLMPLVYGVVIASLIYGIEFWRRGTSSAALAALQGKPIIVTQQPASPNGSVDGRFKSIVLSVENISGHRVVLTGATASCTCLAIQDLPAEIPTGETRSIRVQLRSNDDGAFPMSRLLDIYTDDTNLPIIKYELRGRE